MVVVEHAEVGMCNERENEQKYLHVASCELLINLPTTKMMILDYDALSARRKRGPYIGAPGLMTQEKMPSLLAGQQS